MIAVDTNLLVYAHREEMPWHSRALECVESLAEGRHGPWALPWSCLHEFLAVVTHPRIFKPPTPLDVALDQVAAWLESPSLVPIAENDSAVYMTTLHDLLTAARITGPAVHDARIAAVCLHHRVRELWSADRDFGRFPALSVRNPLVAE